MKKEPSQEILDLLWQTIPPICHAARGLTHEIALDENRITPSQFHTLRRISKRSESVSDLAECMHLNRSNVSRTVDELVQNGLVSRKRDPDDRRKIELSLTPKGWSLIKTLHEKIGREMKGRFSMLTPVEIEDLRNGLLALQKIFRRQENPLEKP